MQRRANAKTFRHLHAFRIPMMPEDGPEPWIQVLWLSLFAWFSCHRGCCVPAGRGAAKEKRSWALICGISGFRGFKVQEYPAFASELLPIAVNRRRWRSTLKLVRLRCASAGNTRFSVFAAACWESTPRMKGDSFNSSWDHCYLW